MDETPKKILFVEDEPIAQTIYGNRLKRERFDVSFAEDGELALQILARGRPDLVVLDLMLPKVSGAEVLKHIRSEPGLKDVPVLILSNAYVTELTQRAMESGATRSMLKSECTPAKLVETVRDMLGYVSCFELSDNPQSFESQIEAFTAAAEFALEDEKALAKTREEFIQKTKAEIVKIRKYSLAYIKATGTPAGREPLNHLHQLVRFFATRAGMSGCGGLAILASAFEALLYESLYKPERATPSTSQTIAQAVDCLERLFQKTDFEAGELNLRAKILVVDDDAVCNLAMLAALKRANLQAVCVDDASRALEMASAELYDIVLLDISMPGMSGFELCEKFRQMHEYRVTPIIFVTSSADFQSRARGILSGGNDLIPKPVSPVELVLKITLHLLRPQGAWAETSALAEVLKTSMRLLQPDAPEAESSEPNRGLPPVMKNGSSLDGSPQNAPIPFTLEKPLIPGGRIGAANQAPPSEEETGLVKPAEIAASIKAPELEQAARTGDRPDPEKAASFEVKDKTPEMEGGSRDATSPATPLPSQLLDAPPPMLETQVPAVDASNIPPRTTGTDVLTRLMGVSGPHESVKPETPALAEAGGPAKEFKAAEVAEEPAKADAPSVPTVPAPAAEPLPISNVIPFPTDSKPEHRTINMETKNKPTFEEATRGVARIIFGDDNISDMNVRLTRIALERYNVAGTKNTDEIARGVARIIFGDDKISDMNVRLTRIALDSYNITEFLGANGHEKPVENGAVSSH